jgi:hypothetical protein
VIGLLDACVVIDVLRGDAGALSAAAGMDALVASEVTRFEVLAGTKPGEERATEELIDAVEWLDVDEGVARRAGALAQRYRPSHSGIDAPDYLVAATALEFGIPLLTRNVRHFPMLPGLEPAY